MAGELQKQSLEYIKLRKLRIAYLQRNSFNCEEGKYVVTVLWVSVCWLLFRNFIFWHKEGNEDMAIKNFSHSFIGWRFAKHKDEYQR